MTFLIGVFVFLLGIASGSFISVVTYRLPLGESVVRPGSRCTSCKEPITWKYNIPVLGYFLTKGKCAFCREKISVRYPFFELLTGLLFLAVDLRSSTYWLLPSYLVLVTGLIIVSIIDIKTMTIPRKVLYPILCIGFIWLIIVSLVTNDEGALLRSVIAGTGAFAIFTFLFLLFPRGIGFGDVRMIGVSSFFVGWIGYKDVLLAVIIGIITAGLAAIFLLIGKKVSAKSRIPLGPFLAFGAIVVILYGPAIVKVWWR